jgi:hypothetical protein
MREETMTRKNPLLRLEQLGQSIWLDYIRRHLITSGGLRRLIEEDGLKGVTSNPAIFEKAIAGSKDYDEAIRALNQHGRPVVRLHLGDDLAPGLTAFSEVMRQALGQQR